MPGDLVTVYAGGTGYATATIEREPTRDQFTPAGYVTLWTSCGRFDVPAIAQLTVRAWAPLGLPRPPVQPPF
jgi:hypothetical protein